MGIIILMLPVEKETAAALRVQVPKQHAKTATGKVASQVDGCSSFANTSFDIINGNLFQKLKLMTKP